MNRPHPPAARPTDGQRDALRATLLAARRFAVYRPGFAAAGLTDEAVRADPAAALARLPLFRPEMLAPLAREALEQRGRDLGGVELSSGSGGLPKRRILSEEDVALDAALVTRLLEAAGVEAGDRAVALELTVTPLATAFLEGCERLGVEEVTAVAWRPGADVRPLERLAPSVLIAPPSLLDRLAPSWPGLRLAIFNGDRLGAPTAERLRAAGVGLRSLYGLTETSALGVSCAAEAGVHLAPEHALAEVLPGPRGTELIVTTLGFSMPLLRYPTGDRVRRLRGRCPCGRDWPRVEILGRLGPRFALFEIETSVEEIRALLLPDEPETLLQVRLTDSPGGIVRMTLALPAPLLSQRRVLLKRLAAHPLIDHLLAARLLKVGFAAQRTVAGRKPALLVDRRSGGEGGRARR